MLINGLNIILKGSYRYFSERRQPLALENLFFVYIWFADAMTYALYTEKELR